ncbi:MAG: hypothetical protein H6Q35_2302 [Proteobacteria bacterium]|nr:hypothetical protein [Pseudomonadota bacterium]
MIIYQIFLIFIKKIYFCVKMSFLYHLNDDEENKGV